MYFNINTLSTGIFLGSLECLNKSSSLSLVQNGTFCIDIVTFFKTIFSSRVLLLFFFGFYSQFYTIRSHDCWLHAFVHDEKPKHDVGVHTNWGRYVRYFGYCHVHSTVPKLQIPDIMLLSYRKMPLKSTNQRNHISTVCAACVLNTIIINYEQRLFNITHFYFILRYIIIIY